MPRDDDDYDAPAPKAPAKSNAAGLALSIIGLVLGVCALLFSFIPCLGTLAFWPGVVAIIISVIGLVVSTSSKALPITAVVVAALGTGIAYWQGTRIKDAVQEGVKQGQQAIDDAKKINDENIKKMQDAMKNMKPPAP